VSGADGRVAVIGGGAWGRALAMAAARAGSRVTLVSRRGGALDGVEVTSDMAAAARARLLVLTVPSEQVATVAAQLEPHLDGGHYLVHGVRGLVGDELRTISDVVRAETPVRRVGALGGPILAEELERGAPSVMVVGSHYREVIDVARESFSSPGLRLYATRDLVGLEWASALTGCLAIAIGYAIGAGMGPGLVAAFTTRAVHEAARIAGAAGGDHATLLGLAGLGDLLAAVGQQGRPEVVFGKALAEGKSPEQARALAGQRMEALDLLPVLCRWAETHHVRTIIIPAVFAFFSGNRSRDETIHHLMNAPLVGEE
jgi:glycerol-3-phosphate dehydrogenase (NAD(P)+)